MLTHIKNHWPHSFSAGTPTLALFSDKMSWQVLDGSTGPVFNMVWLQSYISGVYTAHLHPVCDMPHQRNTSRAGSFVSRSAERPTSIIRYFIAFLATCPLKRTDYRKVNAITGWLPAWFLSSSATRVLFCLCRSSIWTYAFVVRIWMTL